MLFDSSFPTLSNRLSEKIPVFFLSRDNSLVYHALRSHQIPWNIHAHTEVVERKKKCRHNNNRVETCGITRCSSLLCVCVYIHTRNREKERRLPRWRKWRWGNAPIFSPRSFFHWCENNQIHRHTHTHSRTHTHTHSDGVDKVFPRQLAFSRHTHTLGHTHFDSRHTLRSSHVVV